MIQRSKQSIQNEFEAKNIDSFYYSQEFELTFSFSEILRIGYIKKVYGILSLQLLITLLFTIWTMNSSSLQTFQKEKIGILIICVLLAIILPCVLVCFQTTMRSVPYNYIILFIFTIAESYIVSYFCSVTEPKIVFMAAFETFSLVVSLTIYAFTTKTDFTTKRGMIFVLICAVFMFSIFYFLTSNQFFHILVCFLFIIVYGWFLLYDTQLILGNKENALDTEDYILGAFMLYTDIVYLFVRILDLLKNLKSRD